MNDWINETMNQWINEPFEINDSTNEKPHDCVKPSAKTWTNELMNQEFNEKNEPMNHNVSTKTGTNEQINQWNNEAMSWQWVNECEVSETKTQWTMKPWINDMTRRDMKWHKPKWN